MFTNDSLLLWQRKRHSLGTIRITIQKTTRLLKIYSYWITQSTLANLNLQKEQKKNSFQTAKSKDPKSLRQ